MVIFEPWKEIKVGSSLLTTFRIEFNESYRNTSGLYMQSYVMILDGLHSSGSSK